jgi:outer membrane receptor protein involved in Fe transport
MRISTLKAGTALVSLSIALPVLIAPALADPIETVTVTAKRLAEARSGIQTQTGASTYNITSANIESQPGGENTLLNQVILQAPSVAQDSFGQFHVRGEHNALQYRLNGIILPEGISVFGQALDPRLAGSVSLITGALPAEYGLITGGIVDIRTKTGLFQPGGQIGVYGGSHNELEPSFDYGGSSGSLNYFVSGDFLTNTLGIESPDGSANPIHDRTVQYHGFGYVEDILDEHSSLTAILGTSIGHYDLPDNPGQPTQFDIHGVGDISSSTLDERQREITHYGIVSYLHSQGALDFQISGFARYSSLNFAPDILGDIEFNGIAQAAFKRDEAYGAQAEGAWHLDDAHTIRGGLIVKTDRLTSRTTSQVLPADCTGSGTIGDPFDCTEVADPNNVPFAVVDNGAATQNTFSAYLQDEWKVLSDVTINYGLRFDEYKAFSKGSQLSPRVNVVWEAGGGTTLHAGYSRYFSPPPFELIATESVDKFLNTTASPAITLNDTPVAERANYFDVGISQKFSDALSVGLDSYYKISRNLIDEGQFGAPIILTPFNYRKGRQYGVELTADYTTDTVYAYGSAALQHAEGEDIVSSQFQFDPGDLTYIQDHFIHLDHEQYLTMSGGVFYLWHGTRFGGDFLYGSGLRKDGAVPNGDHVPGYTQVNLDVTHDFDLGNAGSLTARLDVINVLDETYEIRDGSGIGVGAPQFGPRRGLFFGLSKSI